MEDEYLNDKMDEAITYVKAAVVDDTRVMRPLVDAALGGIDPLTDPERMETVTKHAVLFAAALVARRTLDIEEDRIDGLESDLFDAVQVAYNRGAEEWATLNYPAWKERLEAGRKRWIERERE